VKVIYMLTNCDKKPSIEVLTETFDIGENDIDLEFGIEDIDASKGDYCILVEEDVAKMMAESLSRA